MEKTFMCSLICQTGILGGGISIDNVNVTYKTNKLTVDKKYRNLVLSRNEICELTWSWMIFPIATFKMLSGEQYKFIIFNKGGFEKHYNEVNK